MKPLELTTLDSGSFGSTRHGLLSIEGTGLASVDDETFQGSKDSVYSITIRNYQNSQFNFKSLKNLNKLSTLQITEGRLSELPQDAFLQVPGLRTIDLSNNSLTTLRKGVFDNLLKLEKINLSNNKIATIEEVFVNLPKLERIDLSNNRLTTIGEDVFHMPNGLANLRIILNSNQIESIHKYAFRDVKFRKLSLKNNHLETLDEDVFELLLEYLTYFRVEDGSIDIEGNTFKCDSSILWLVKKPFWHKERVLNFECKHNRKNLSQLKDSNLS